MELHAKVLEMASRRCVLNLDILARPTASRSPIVAVSAQKYTDPLLIENVSRRHRESSRRPDVQCSRKICG